MHHSLPLRRLVQQRVAGTVRKIRVDLRYCTYIDSTFLGTLLLFQRTAARLEGGEFYLITPSPECSCLFKQMGVTDVFQIIQMDEPVVDFWTVLSKEGDEPASFQRNVLQAHEELATLPGKAGEPFRAVVRCLKRDSETKS